jgi:hypothetical protein
MGECLLLRFKVDTTRLTFRKWMPNQVVNSIYQPYTLATPPSLYYRNMNLTEIFEIVFLIFVWYASSSLTNNLNKTILADDFFPFPYTLTLYQFGSIALCCYIMVQVSSSNYKLQTVNTSFAKLVIPLCASQIIAHLLTQSSLQHVPVSFTHTIKVHFSLK